MTNISWDAALAAIEHQLHTLTAGVQRQDPQSVLQAAGVLQQDCVDFMQQLQNASPQSLRVSKPVVQRLRAISLELGRVREHLLRSSAYVDKALQVVLATEPASTYGNATSRYAAVARQSGAFRVLAA